MTNLGQSGQFAHNFSLEVHKFSAGLVCTVLLHLSLRSLLPSTVTLNKGHWDIWLLGQKVFGTFGVWDKSLDFWIFLGHMALGQNVIGTIYLWAERFWDNSPRVILSLGQKA